MDDMIRQFAIFRDLTADEFTAIKKYYTIREYAIGDVVLKNAAAEKALFIVARGSVVGTSDHNSIINRKETRYLPGDFFGEVSLCTGTSTDGVCAAEESCMVVSITENAFNEMIRDNSVIAVKFISQLLSLTIHRLRGFSTFFADIVQWGENASRRVITDELTGVYNRLFLDDVLENFFNISKSNNKPLSLFMIDLDNFRKINETLGMEKGNTILRTVVLIIKKAISKHGIIARYGGDEFAVLLPETGIEKAQIIAEQIRADVENRDFSKQTEGSGLSITLSIGISSFPDTVSQITAFKEKADASLYKAKNLGRNCVSYIE